MKKTLLLIPVFLVLFFSCKKDNDDPQYYVKLKINGNWVTWSGALGELGPDLGNPAKTDLGITATDGNQNDVFDISIQVDGTTFNTGAYASDNLNYLVLVSYYKDASAANSRFFEIDDAPTMPASKYTVNITSISSTEIQGNFVGNYLYDNFNDEIFNLTEGEFKVLRVR